LVLDKKEKEKKSLDFKQPFIDRGGFETLPFVDYDTNGRV